jgi:hypothetical protein
MKQFQNNKFMFLNLVLTERDNFLHACSLYKQQELQIYKLLSKSDFSLKFDLDNICSPYSNMN